MTYVTDGNSVLWRVNRPVRLQARWREKNLLSLISDVRLRNTCLANFSTVGAVFRRPTLGETVDFLLEEYRPGVVRGMVYFRNRRNVGAATTRRFWDMLKEAGVPPQVMDALDNLS